MSIDAQLAVPRCFLITLGRTAKAYFGDRPHQLGTLFPDQSFPRVLNHVLAPSTIRRCMLRYDSFPTNF